MFRVGTPTPWSEADAGAGAAECGAHPGEREGCLAVGEANGGEQRRFQNSRQSGLITCFPRCFTLETAFSRAPSACS